MSRKIRTPLPILPSQLKPKLPKIKQLRKKENQIRSKMKKNFDDHHKAKELRPLQSGENVFILIAIQKEQSVSRMVQDHM